MIQLIGKASIALILMSLFLPRIATAQPRGIRVQSPQASRAALGSQSTIVRTHRSAYSSDATLQGSAPSQMPPSEMPMVLSGADGVIPDSILLDGVVVDGVVRDRGAELWDGAGVSTCRMPVANWLLDWSRAEVLVGTLAYTGAADFLNATPAAMGESGGNFGFQEGFNFGSQLPSLMGGELGVQFGMRFTHTNLDGSRIANDHRNQLFLTTGLFRRVDCGLQGGLAVDYLHEDWLYQADLFQLRGELSWILSDRSDVGFRFTDSRQTDNTTAMTDLGPLDVSLASLNTYRFFYRHRFGARGTGNADWQLGFTENSQAVMAIELDTPLVGELGLQTTATYVLPEQDTSNSYRDESWNMGLAIVWTPGRCFGTQRDYYRPLFEVADNGILMTARP